MSKEKLRACASAEASAASGKPGVIDNEVFVDFSPKSVFL